MPMYSTEYDINLSNDEQQLQRFKEQIPYMWEADYCAGVTLWGYIYGKTWKDYTGLIKNGTERPALTWLREYMQSAAAKNAKSPFPGMVKEASVYIKPSAINVAKDASMNINVDARLRTKTIQKVDLYVDGALYQTFTAAPFSTAYTPGELRHYDLKAVVTATDGTTYERVGGFTAHNRTPFNGEITIPGTIEVENFDGGSEGFTYHDSDTKNEGDNTYRSDGGGVDIVKGGSGYAIGYTAEGEWMEYTVNVTEAGLYSFDANVASGSTDSAFSLYVVRDGMLAPLCKVKVPQTASNDWSVYKTVSGTFVTELEKGPQVIRLVIDAPYCNIDKIELKLQSSGISGIRNDLQTSEPTYNLNGQQTGKHHKGVVVSKGRLKIVR